MNLDLTHEQAAALESELRRIMRHSGITDLRVARTANGEIAVKPEIER
jgi:hypothetical protein